MTLEEMARALRDAQADVDHLTPWRKQLEEQLAEVRAEHMRRQAKVADLKIRLLDLAMQEAP